MNVISNISDQSFDECVATIGFFDGVHRGHLSLIDRVKAVAVSERRKSAVITFSVPPRQVVDASFVPQLLTTNEEKMELLSESGIDECFILQFTKEMSGLSARQFMNDVLREQYNVRHLVIGYDHRFGYNRSEGFEDYVRFGQELGILVENVNPYKEDAQIVSSSLIRQLLKEGDVAAVSKGLGYSYMIKGEVVGGHQLGREMGFPTANLKLDNPYKLLPAHGVYAVRVIIDGSIYKGMLNIGTRPTMNNGRDCSIEVFILDFNSDIYHQQLSVSFIERIRSEQKFESMEALEVQLQRDRQQVESILQ